MLGRKVAILEMMETLNDGGNNIHALALMNEINRYSITISTATRAAEINENGVIGEYVGSAFTLLPCKTLQETGMESNSVGRVVRADAEEGSRKLFEADTVVHATGQQSLHDEADALRFYAQEFHQIGDCLAPRNIHQAVRMASAIARDI